MLKSRSPIHSFIHLIHYIKDDANIHRQTHTHSMNEGKKKNNENKLITFIQKR